MKIYVQFHQLISGKSRDERRRHDYFTPIPLMLCSPTCGVETNVDDTDILLKFSTMVHVCRRQPVGLFRAW